MAAVNRLNARNFAIDMGFSLKKIIVLDPASVRNLANRGGLNANHLEDLISWTGRRVGNVRMTFRGEVFVTRALRNPRIRGCPICLREDADAHDGVQPKPWLCGVTGNSEQ